MSPTTRPRNPWPIAITGFFILAAMFLAVFIVWAVRQREDLVSANYYENEIRYQQQLDSMNRSRPFAAQTAITYDAAQHSIVINLPDARIQSASGRIHLYRPSDARLDREVPLAIDADGVQRLDASKLVAGLWKVRIKWNAAGEEFLLDLPVIVPRRQS